MNFVFLKKFPILEQLRLEEALLRADQEEWCLVNVGSPPAIVMGISGKPEALIDLPRLQREPLPLIKRFTGGGTVVVDEETLFVTFIRNSSSHPTPRGILEWSEQLYRPLFASHPFRLIENDYVLGEHKCGGNAQYIQRGRWLHHTSFLWDFCPTKMDYLLLPQRRPTYRKDRPHTAFLCTLKSTFPSQEAFLSQLKSHLSQLFPLKETSLEEITPLLERPHRRSTQMLPY